jgi:hypothetical protein
MLTACTTQSTAPASSEPVSQASQSSANPTPQAQGKNQGTRAPQQQNTPVPRDTPQPKQQQNTAPRQTPQNTGGSDATQNQALDMPAHSIDVILGRPTQKSITASIVAYQDGEGYIEFGTQAGVHPNKTPIQKLTREQSIEILMDALSPNTQYFFQVFYRAGNAGAFASLAEKSFYTQRTSGSTFTFDIQADSHLDSNSNLDVYARTLANMVADKPDFLIDLGDTFMTNKYQPYTASQKQYLAQRYFLGLLAPSPLFLALGNHDGEGAPQNATLNDMSTWAAKLRTQYFPNPMPNDFYSGNATTDKLVGELENYYAWEWGDALFVVRDPYRFTTQQRGGGSDIWNTTLGTAQYQWLKKTLETSRAKWKFVFIHQLVGGLDSNGRGGVEAAKLYEWGGNNADGSYGFAAKRPGWAMPIHQLLVQNKVTAVFHGHDHLFVKQDLDGIVYQEVPQPSNARSDQTNNAKEYGYVTGDVLGGPGHLRIAVSSSQVKIDYVRSYLPEDENTQRKNGKVDYSYTLTAR